MNDESLTTQMEPYSTVSGSYLTSLIAGGVAGTSADVALYPLDTIKVSGSRGCVTMLCSHISPIPAYDKFTDAPTSYGLSRTKRGQGWGVA
jgi:hypothetical protein